MFPRRDPGVRVMPCFSAPLSASASDARKLGRADTISEIARGDASEMHGVEGDVSDVICGDGNDAGAGGMRQATKASERRHEADPGGR